MAEVIHDLQALALHRYLLTLMYTTKRLPLVCAVLLLSLTSGCKFFEKGESPTGPSTPTAPPTSGTAVAYTAIGASDANGVGSTVQCAPFEPCENGTGYVPVLARAMRTGRQVTTTNLGILGTVLSPAIQQIARQNGRDIIGNFVEQQAPFVPRDTTLVTIFGGGNDVNALTDAVERGAAGTTDVRSYIDTQVRAFGADYDRLIRAVRDRAAGSFIIVMNAPNFAALPNAVGYGIERRRIMQHMSVGFSREANRQASQGIVVLDLMCDAQVYDPSRFSSDGFHPNDAGYAYLAQRLLAIVNGSSSSPSTSCSQMTVVPPL
jgi:lysophospholipase L1-like esterase